MKAFEGAFAAICLLAASPIYAQEPQLIAVNVWFVLPKCDNRDHDTRIDMSITRGDRVVAEAVDMAPGRELSDPGRYGPFPMAVTAATPHSAYRETITRLHVTPNGNDRWCTRVDVEAVFSDNSKMQTSSCVVIQVSEITRDVQFPNRPCK